MTRAAIAGLALALVAFAAPSLVRADTPRVAARVGLAHAVGSPQSDDFGFGAGGEISGELPLASVLAAEARASLLLLAPSTPPPSEPKRSLATLGLLAVGPKLRPLGVARSDGPWLGLGAGLAVSGSDPRFGANAELGWDVRLGRAIFLEPFLAYTHVLEPGTTRPSEADAHVLWGGLGISVDLQVPVAAPAPEPSSVPAPLADDADRDGIRDAEDACPNVRGVHTQDLNTNGCPPKDTDQDGVPDSEDACPNLAGKPRPDPRMNGCPDVLPPRPPPEPEEPPPPAKPAPKKDETLELD